MRMLNKLAVLFVCYIAQFDLINAQEYESCTTPLQEQGTCVKLDQCNELYAVLRNPKATADERQYLKNSQCGHINRTVLICCPSRINVVTITTLPSLTLDPSTTEHSTRIQQPTCGSVLKSRIVGGNITHITDFPWMALIEFTTAQNVRTHICGGTLISNRYVLTAAHCVIGRKIPSDWHLSGVRLGEWNKTSNPDCDTDALGKRICVPEHIDVDVEEMIPHPQYDSRIRSEYNDIALLRLARSVPNTIHIMPICLPTSESLRNLNMTGRKLDICGWGVTENETSSAVKLKATVKVWDFDQCNAIYTRNRRYLTTSQLCAGGVEGIDTCQGDSGGPLMAELDDLGHTAFYLMGVTSFGPTTCGLDGVPGVYTRVGAYIEWIENNMK